ncbi:hypothetical protein TNCV_3025551 [Trichonephila clavipes]|nr:hypothetical protein TNCV_3025551 [Trichonephila clavipes]
MGSRTRGRPPTRWIDDVENDLKTLNIKNCQSVAAYRWNWKKRAVEAAKTCNRIPAMSGNTCGYRMSWIYRWAVMEPQINTRVDRVL